MGYFVFVSFPYFPDSGFSARLVDFLLFRRDFCLFSSLAYQASRHQFLLLLSSFEGLYLSSYSLPLFVLCSFNFFSLIQHIQTCICLRLPLQCLVPLPIIYTFSPSPYHPHLPTTTLSLHPSHPSLPASPFRVLFLPSQASISPSHFRRSRILGFSTALLRLLLIVTCDLIRWDLLMCC